MNGALLCNSSVYVDPKDYLTLSGNSNHFMRQKCPDAYSILCWIK